MSDVIIVGAGLFGSMAAALCKKNGHSVTVIDDNRGYSGSAPAACLIKPSWLQGLSKQARTEGMSVLNELYDVNTITFKTDLPGVTADVFHVDPTTILIQPDVLATVTSIKDNIVETTAGTFTGKVLVAAGVWSDTLVAMDSISRLVGAACVFTGKAQPKIHVWAPYRQAVSFNWKPDEVWFGDGTAILEKNWNTSERLDQSLERASKQGLTQDLDYALVGMRPYIKGHKNGYFKKLSDNLWVSSGGAKNGTILAAYQAKLFLQQLS